MITCRPESARVLLLYLQDLEEQKRTKYKINGTATTAIEKSNPNRPRSSSKIPTPVLVPRARVSCFCNEPSKVSCFCNEPSKVSCFSHLDQLLASAPSPCCSTIRYSYLYEYQQGAMSPPAPYYSYGTSINVVESGLIRGGIFLFLFICTFPIYPM